MFVYCGSNNTCKNFACKKTIKGKCIETIKWKKIVFKIVINMALDVLIRIEFDFTVENSVESIFKQMQPFDTL